ncbi:hypothetical protein MHBO_004676 [Bonamia ostreae]|uniref:Uncharacterized protein n=1 Tax=Bonamia ostreae TaxID=126728 RepID=A0ABV2ATY5_9EUKA
MTNPPTKKIDLEDKLIQILQCTTIIFEPSRSRYEPFCSHTVPSKPFGVPFPVQNLPFSSKSVRSLIPFFFYMIIRNSSVNHQWITTSHTKEM